MSGFARIFLAVRKAIRRIPYHPNVRALSLLDDSHGFRRGREVSVGLQPDLDAVVSRFFCKTSNALRDPIASGIAVSARLYLVSENTNARRTQSRRQLRHTLPFLDPSVPFNPIGRVEAAARTHTRDRQAVIGDHSFRRSP